MHIMCTYMYDKQVLSFISKCRSYFVFYQGNTQLTNFTLHILGETWVEHGCIIVNNLGGTVHGWWHPHPPPPVNVAFQFFPHPTHYNSQEFLSPLLGDPPTHLIPSAEDPIRNMEMMTSISRETPPYVSLKARCQWTSRQQFMDPIMCSFIQSAKKKMCGN